MPDERLLSEAQIQDIREREAGCIASDDLSCSAPALLAHIDASQACCDALALALAETGAAGEESAHWLQIWVDDTPGGPWCYSEAALARWRRVLAADPDARGTALLEAAASLLSALEHIETITREDMQGFYGYPRTSAADSAHKIAKVAVEAHREVLLGPGGRGAGG